MGNGIYFVQVLNNSMRQFQQGAIFLLPYDQISTSNINHGCQFLNLHFITIDCQNGAYVTSSARVTYGDAGSCLKHPYSWCPGDRTKYVSMFSKFDENSYNSSSKKTRPITTILCTNQDSYKVLVCAKLGRDRMNLWDNNNNISIKVEIQRNFCSKTGIRRSRDR